ncbi:para-nitrobenzyl esterase [Colletotrichum karsti]|uniref:Carboxylic ester hydrolase n=1 Tax=Colletotrichum karsti TaxID=1095194 RepID=A0A9P6IHK8_9PEZI|nr:para-nitrobenzyl esterase [Colletotrichum karsti]KAF9879145.1 para-nitrobenzyl esterase [Colletotrichum karsti]
MRLQSLVLAPLGVAAAATNATINTNTNSTSAKACPARPATATISSGVINGVATSLPNALSAVNKFLGIPYAAPPARFALPQPPAPWTNALNTTAFGPSCYQNFVDNPVATRPEVTEALYNNPPAPESEDCLTINVFAPAKKPRAKRAVIVFIPGGAFQIGNGRADLSAFAAYEDIVAVDFNYRNNIFGFPSSPQIPITERNLGLYDQRLALQWVQENIASFGGDPDKVTIWGHSAGATSVDYLLRAYGRDDAPPAPFRAAVMLSGQSTYGLAAASYPTNGTMWQGIAAEVGCSNATDVLECVRRVPAADLIDAQRSTGILTGPERDNVTFLPDPVDSWESGDVAKVPLLMGTVAQEGRGLVNDRITLDLFFSTYLPATLVPAAARELIVATYRATGLTTDFDIAAAIYTDYVFQCPAALLAETATSIDIPTWRYYFNTSILTMVPPELSFLGVFHGSDLFLLLTNPATTKYTVEQYEVYEYLRGGIARFVKDPAGGPGWAAVGSGPDDVVVLGDVGSTPTAAAPFNATLLDAKCALYAPLYPILQAVLG